MIILHHYSKPLSCLANRTVYSSREIMAKYEVVFELCLLFLTGIDDPNSNYM